MTRSARIRNVLFGVGICSALGFGAASASAHPRSMRAIVTDTAEECTAYCTSTGKAHSSWDPRTGACHCW